MTLKIGKQRELPRRPGDYRTSKGDMNRVPPEAEREAEEIRRRREDTPPAPPPDKPQK